MTKEFMDAITPKEMHPKPKPKMPEWLKAILLITAGVGIAETYHAVEIETLFAEPPKDVMGRMLATPVKLELNYYLANVVGVKLRDCPVKDGSFVGWAHDQNWRITEFEFADAPGSNARRPTGQQDFGFWQWKIKPEDTAVRITMIHDCPDGEVHTEIGPFYIPRAIKIGEA